MLLCKPNQTKCVCIPEPDSLHREADQKILMHVVYAGRDSSNKVCVIADDTDIYLSLINIAHLVKSCVYFRQGKTKDKNGITYHDINAIANHLSEEICTFLPAFHMLTGSDFTSPFFNRLKIQAFKKILRISNSHKLLLSLPSGKPNISEVIDFVLHVVLLNVLHVLHRFTRPLKEKTPGELRYNMLMRRKSKQRTGRKVWH